MKALLMIHFSITQRKKIGLKFYQTRIFFFLSHSSYHLLSQHATTIKNTSGKGLKHLLKRNYSVEKELLWGNSFSFVL